MRIFIAVLLFVMPMAAHAAQTCERGYYKTSPDAECKKCPSGYYCPDDDNDNAIECPADNTDWENLLLNECGYHPLELSNFRIASWDIMDGSKPAYKITYCFSRIHVELQEGVLTIEQKYNTTRQDYFTSCRNLDLFYVANPGYYLSEYKSTSTHVWYYGIKPCTNEHPTHSHYSGPGTPDDPVKTGGKTDYNDCPWACDDGYGLHNDACMPLCSAGATEFHVGEYVFNIYADKLTTPAINIELGNGSVCYVPLVEGSGKGALNVDYNGTVYHTSD